MTDSNAERVLLACVVTVSALLLLPNLGNQFLWQDEAQTAVISRTILDHGVPLGYDGKNHFSQEQGREYGEGYVWKWHTWLSFYITAASLAVLGNTSFAARLPPTLFAIATVGLAYWVGRRLWRSRAAAFAGAGMLALSIPFLIFGRQGRYYSQCAFLSLLGLHGYAGIGGGRGRPALVLFVAAVLLFHTHYVYCATLLATVIAHALLFERAKLRPVLLVSAGVSLLNLPWIIWFSGIRPGGDAYLEGVLDVSKVLGFTTDYLGLVLTQLFDLRLLAIPVLLVVWRLFKQESVLEVSPETRRNLFLLVFFCLVNAVVLAALSPLLYYRYLAPLVPVVFLVIGLMVGALWQRSRAVAVLVVALWAYTGALGDHLHELTHDFDGPIEGIAFFLNQRAEEGDIVATSYGDMPLKFHTDLRVLGGLTGEDLGDLPDARFVIVRHRSASEEDARVRRLLLEMVQKSPGRYRRYELPFPDTLFENREDPRQHRFRTAPGNLPRVEVFEKIR